MVKKIVIKINSIISIAFTLLLLFLYPYTLKAQMVDNTISAASTICVNAPITITGNVPSGCTAPYTYIWESSTDNSAWTNTGATAQNYPTSITGNTYFRRVANATGPGCSNVISNSLGVQAIPLPQTPINPLNATICANDPALLSADPVPSNASISWFDAAVGGNFLGSGNQYTPAPPNTTTYYAASVNACGTSANRLAVTATVIILNNPTGISAPSRCGPGQVTLTATPGNNGNDVLWYFPSNTNIGQGSPFTYSVTGTINVFVATLNTSNNCTSNQVQTTITVFPVLGNNQISTDQIICTGSTPSNLTGSTPTGGDGLYTYNWESSSDLVTWGATGQAGVNYTTGALTQNIYYRRIVSSNQCNPITSNIVVIQVDNLISQNTVGVDQTICTGFSPALFTGTTPTGGNGTFSYSWQSSTNNTTYNPIPSTNSQNYAATALTASTYFRRVITSGACPSITSASLYITVIPAITNNTVGSAQTLCTGSAPVGFTGSNPGGGTGIYSYQWESSTNNSTFNPITGATNLTYSHGSMTTTLFFRRVVTSVCANTSVSFQVLVNSNIGNNTVTANQTVCQNIAGANLNGTFPNGGNGLYTYVWESSTDNVNWSATTATGQNFAPPAISQNTYFRRIVSSAPCLPSTSNAVSFLVNFPIGDNSITQAQTICSNQAAAVLTGSTPSGGSGSYTYSWESSTDNVGWTNIGQNVINYNPGLLSASRYWRRVVASAPCPSNNSQSVYILVYPALTNTTISAAQIICTGSTPTLLSGLVVGGGTGSYSYQWQSSNNNVAWADITGETNATHNPGPMTSALYFRRSINSLPCTNISNSINVQIQQPIGNNNVGNANTICSGVNPGNLTGSLPSGGSNAYTYTWQSSTDSINWVNVGGNVQTLNPGVLNASRYFRRVVTSGACSPNTSAGFLILVNPGITSNTVTGNQTICSGSQPADLSGSSPTGGNGVYSYVWETSSNNVNWAVDPQETTQDFLGIPLTSSLYFRRVVQSPPCPSVTSNSVMVTVQNNIGSNTAAASQTICSGTAPVGFAGSIPSGGGSIYAYQWMSSTDNFTFTDIPGATQSNYQAPILTANAYFRRVVQSGVCQPSTTFPLSILVHEPIGTNTIGTAQSICANTAFQVITGTLPTGGSTQYTYSWQTSTDNVNWFPVNNSTGSDQQPFNISGSRYFRRIVTSPPCPANTSSQILIFAEPAIGNNLIGPGQTICTGSTPLAFTGAIATGGNSTFSYQWESSLNTVLWTTMPGETNTGFAPNALTITTYYRRMAQSGLCTPESSNLLMIQVDNFITGNTIGANQTVCLATVPAPLTGLVPLGGSGSYSYQWETSSDSTIWAPAGGIDVQQNFTSGPLFITTYYRRVVQSGVCNQSTSQVVTIIMENFMSGNILGNAQTICAGSVPDMFTGTSPSGGGGVFTYTWESSTDNVVWGAIPGVTTVTYTHGALSTPTYFRRIAASGLCPVLPSNGVLVNVQQGITNNNVGVNQAICEGVVPALLTGSIPAGGNGIYAYEWEVSSDNLSWAPAVGVSNNIDYLPTVALTSNTYFRRIVSSGVCANSLSNLAIISVNPIPIVTIQDIEVCLGRSGPLVATPSLPGGFYLWNTGATTPAIVVGPFITTTYSVQYTLNGCISPLSEGVVTVNPLPNPVITPLGPTILCPGGSVSLSASGGASYLWTTGQSTNTITVSSPGTYRVIVTDTKGCIDSTIIAITQPAPVAITPTVRNPSCFGLLDGSVSLVVVGGTLPYSYSWNTNPIQTIPNIFNLGPGTYSVSVSDAIGCQATSSVILTEPRPLAIYSTVNTIACTPLLDNGVANTFVSGGTPPYNYAWNTNPIQNNASAFNLTPGSYAVAVTDGNGCVIGDTVTLVSDISPSVQASRDTFVCANSGGVQIFSSGSGGIGPYTYVWTQSNNIIPGSISDEYISNPVVNPDSSGWYYVQAFGSNGCPSDKDSLYVTVYDLPIANAGGDLNFCDEAPGVFLQGSVGNPIGGYSVQWMPSTGLFCDTCLVTYAQPAQTTIYTLRITNTETGCKSDSTTLNTLSSVLVTVKDLPVVDAGRDTLMCLGDSITLLGTVTGSGPLYTWDWSPSLELNDRTLQTPNASPLSTVVYYVVATSNGCQSHADSVTVTVIPYPVVAAGQQKNICEGDSIQLAGQVQQGVAQNFLWTPGSGLSDSTALNPMASPQVTTTYTLVAFNQGCPSPSASMLLIVNPVPIADAGLDTVICADGDSIQLNGSYTGGAIPVRYEWSPPGGLERVDIFTPMAKPQATQFYYFRASSGTAPYLCETIDSVLITVVPAMNLEVSVDTTIICPGQAVQFVSSGGIGNPTFQWTPTLGVTNPNSPVTTAFPEVPTRYFVSVTEGGCSDTDFVDIYVHPRPSASFGISQAVGCAPVEVRVQDLSSNAMSYEWRIPGSTFLSNEKEPIFRFDTPGTYAVQLIIRGEGSCTDTILHPVPIDVKGNADVKIMTDPIMPLELSGVDHEIRFEDLTPGATEWFWDFGDGAFSNQKVVLHKYSGFGTYTITLKVKTDQGCEGRGTVGPVTIRETVLSIPNVFTPNGDGINDFFEVDYSGDELYYLQIYDRWGTKYFETRNRNQLWNGKDLNNNDAAEGVYFYTVEVGSKQYSGSVSLLR